MYYIYYINYICYIGNIYYIFYSDYIHYARMCYRECILYILHIAFDCLLPYGAVCNVKKIPFIHTTYSKYMAINIIY